MYSTDAHILRQVCKLLQQIMPKYQLTDEEIYKLADMRSLIMKTIKKIEDQSNAR